MTEIKIDKLDLIKQELDKNATKVEEVNFLFLDLSSTCTGYCVASINFKTKNVVFKEAGAIWFEKSWNNQEKYHYIFKAITNYFYIVSQIDYCFTEAYLVNPKRIQGTNVGSELHGAISVALSEVGLEYADVPVSTWRKHLGVKKDPITKSYKEPTAKKVAEYVLLPKEIPSNITGTLRQIPNDVTDAIGIALGVMIKFGFKQFNFSTLKVQENIGAMN